MFVWVYGCVCVQMSVGVLVFVFCASLRFVARCFVCVVGCCEVLPAMVLCVLFALSLCFVDALQQQGHAEGCFFCVGCQYMSLSILFMLEGVTTYRHCSHRQRRVGCPREIRPRKCSKGCVSIMLLSMCIFPKPSCLRIF